MTERIRQISEQVKMAEHPDIHLYTTQTPNGKGKLPVVLKAKMSHSY